MKKFLCAVTLLASLAVGSRNLVAQGYGAYYYGPHWDAIQYQEYQNYLQWQQYLAYLQLHDPYYDLHAMHYQLYLRQYQPYQVYQPCCYGWGVVSQPSLPIRPEPRPVIDPRGQAIVGPLPPAVAPLPPAIGPLSPASRRR
jgi:hypothetical protein